MERPRFQFGIGTVMVASAAVAVLIWIARTFGTLMAIVCAGPAINAVIYAHASERCRAERQPLTDAERRELLVLRIRVGLPIALAIVILAGIAVAALR